MGREVRRVPLDFDYPLNTVWKGYLLTNALDKGIELPVIGCEDCEKKYPIPEGRGCAGEEAPYCSWHNEELKKLWFEEVPEGEGWQLWSTTSEGSPMTPVFKTPEELAEYCADNCSTFADIKATKEEWLSMINAEFIYATEGNITFM